MVAGQQGRVFLNFKESTKFIEMVKTFGYSYIQLQSTMIFKISITKLINKYPQ